MSLFAQILVSGGHGSCELYDPDDCNGWKTQFEHHIVEEEKECSCQQKKESLHCMEQSITSQETP